MIKNIILASCVFFSTSTLFAQGYTQWYRYYDSNGTPQISQTLTQTHIDKGYEELDSSFAVVRTVKAYNAAEVKAKKLEEEKRLEEEAKKQSHKEKLMDSYGTSQRAERKRIELISDIDSKRRLQQKKISEAKTELKKDLDTAAALEKSGKPVSQVIKDKIAEKKRVVTAEQASLKKLVKQQYADLEKLNISIRELRKFESTP